ncbi:MAG: hypothetical protein A2Y38_00375 [Spirochaetes bacterium GWB1_59_5]|nr:MAG: hypothetical protein A2Y38_00375 [Spirochaetes bacterium GWB1_59_5]
MEVHWHGPRVEDLELDGATVRAEVRPLPPERWPYGLPEAHEDICDLFTWGRFCDCAASAADEDER